MELSLSAEGLPWPRTSRLLRSRAGLITTNHRSINPIIKQTRTKNVML